jgi:hypothetical protein
MLTLTRIRIQIQKTGKFSAHQTEGKHITGHLPYYSKGQLNSFIEGGQLDHIGQEDEAGGSHAHYQVEGKHQSESRLHPETEIMIIRVMYLGCLVV